MMRVGASLESRRTGFFDVPARGFFSTEVDIDENQSLAGAVAAGAGAFGPSIDHLRIRQVVFP